MKIIKILNNNALVCRDVTGKEIIARGKGVAYQKKVGELFDCNIAEKIYSLEGSIINNQVYELLKTIPLEYLDIAKEIVQYAELYLDKTLDKVILVNLIDHIALAVDRLKNGFNIPNPMLYDIKHFFDKEYDIGIEALNIIENSLKIRLPEDEAGFIALHIVNAQSDSNQTNAYEITKVIQEIKNIVRLRFNINYDEKSILYYRFITHLKYFAKRMLGNNIKQYNDDVENEELYLIIKERYSKSFECVNYIKIFLKEKYLWDLSKSEQLYLAIHIERIVKEVKRRDV